MHTIFFSTKALGDAPETLEEHINGFGGNALGEEFRSLLRENGWDCEDLFPEDWGWAFFARKDQQEYLIGSHIAPGSDEAPPQSEGDFGYAIVERQRSLKNKLLGRDKQKTDDQVTSLLEDWIRRQPEMRDVKVEK